MEKKIEDIKLYDLSQVSELLKVTQRTLYNYIKAGKLKAAKIGGVWKVTEDNLRAFMTGG